MNRLVKNVARQKLIKEFIKLALAEGEIARVPNQLLSPDGNESSDTDNEGREEVHEFSSVGGGAVAGYSLPLGTNPDAAGRQKNRPRQKQTKK